MLAFVRLIVLVAATAALVACTSLSPVTALRLRNLDYFSDDLASLVFALDLPAHIRPQSDGSRVTFDVTTVADGERHIDAILVRADSDAVAGKLPQPGNGRLFYVFRFSDDDRSALREAQAWMRELKARGTPAGGQVSIGVKPRFCKTAPVNSDEDRITVHIALPGDDQLNPLLQNARLGEIADGNPANMPDCTT